MSVTVHRLGRVEYEDGLAMQHALQEARRTGGIGDTLLLLEHPPVLTLGRGAKAGNVLVSRRQLEAAGVELHETDRGGDVTYHGPGQVVGYPLLHLGPGKQDVRRYVRALEEVLIRTLAQFGIEAHRESRWPGVWVQSKAGGLKKIAALGVHLSRWYTRHGFALNVRPQLAHFGLIVPCGISEAGVTSMEVELGRAPELAEVEEALGLHFGAVFECETVAAPARVRTVSVVVRGPGHVLLLRRSPSRGGFWQPITGRVEADESPLEAAARELREETGFQAEVRPLQYQHSFWSGGAMVEETAFTARVGEGTPALVEHDAYEWLPAEVAMLRVPFAGLRRAIALSSSL